MASYEYNKKYAQKYMGKLDEIKLRVPKGRKADIEVYAKEHGLSVNALVTKLLQNEMGISDEAWKATDPLQEGEA